MCECLPTWVNDVTVMDPYFSFLSFPFGVTVDAEADVKPSQL